MMHLGDIRSIRGADVPGVDVVTGGSPCQNLSLAGNRTGLQGEESGLFLEQIRLFKEMRDASRANGIVRKPRFLVWENVRGALSCNEGEDFRRVLTEIVHIAEPDAIVPRSPRGEGWTSSGAILGGGWSLAWRVHDAQFWGVPQRRARVAVVADFGGQSSAEILFERKGLRGDFGASAKAREGIAGDVGSRVEEPTFSFVERAGKAGGGKGLLIREEKSAALETANSQAICVAPRSADGHPRVYTDGVSPAITTAQGGGLTPCVVEREHSARHLVRRLTPLECTRLQGFPDEWLDFDRWTDSKGVSHRAVDCAKYKALGNSIALPFWEWMARRMVAVLKRDGEEHPTMASLFDGIGGFPLVFKRAGCVPVWASEIEEFPIAVTKHWFPEVTDDEL